MLMLRTKNATADHPIFVLADIMGRMMFGRWFSESGKTLSVTPKKAKPTENDKRRDTYNMGQLYTSELAPLLDRRQPLRHHEA